MNVITKTVSLPDGRTISIETGKVAKQADGSVMLKMGNTVLLATVCAAKDAVPGTDFMPLQVDYRELYASAGRFPGGFTKREGKPSDNEILTSNVKFKESNAKTWLNVELSLSLRHQYMVLGSSASLRSLRYIF